jgi:predicted Rossmann fold flavoprotein
VPLQTADAWVHQLAGKSIPDMKITFFENDKRAFSLRGPLLFTHFGLSGPLILNAAGKVADLLEAGEVSARIDTYPDLDLGILDRQITKTFDDNKNKLLKNIFLKLAPVGTGSVLLSLLDVDPEKRVHSVTKEERRKIALLLKALPAKIEGLMGFDRAVVADGGVPIAEVDTRSMRSLRVHNAYITGDLLHIRRPSGGYSLQLAWTSGYVAGSHAGDRA